MAQCDASGILIEVQYDEEEFLIHIGLASILLLQMLATDRTLDTVRQRNREVVPCFAFNK